MNEKKPKIAVYWASSCGGCDVAVLGLHEKLLELVDYADIAFWPAAADIKYDDVESMKPGEIDVTLFNGAIRTSENEEIAEMLREKSKILVAYGSCSAQGGIPGLANLSNREDVFEEAYLNNKTTPNPDKITPQNVTEKDSKKLKLPFFYDRVKSLDQVVEVDYTVPGCPPHGNLTEKFVELLLANDLPEKGSVIANEKSVCDECSREWQREPIEKFVRPHEVEVDEEKCLLDQGIICMGPATRGGCDASCPDTNMPCAGCQGPPSSVEDQGTKMLNSLASVFGIGEEGSHLEQEKDILENFPDPVGTFYKYSLPKSIFGGRIEEERKDG